MRLQLTPKNTETQCGIVKTVWQRIPGRRTHNSKSTGIMMARPRVIKDFILDTCTYCEYGFYNPAIPRLQNLSWNWPTHTELASASKIHVFAIICRSNFCQLCNNSVICLQNYEPRNAFVLHKSIVLYATSYNQGNKNQLLSLNQIVKFF